MSGLNIGDEPGYIPRKYQRSSHTNRYQSPDYLRQKFNDARQAMGKGKSSEREATKATLDTLRHELENVTRNKPGLKDRLNIYIAQILNSAPDADTYIRHQFEQLLETQPIRHAEPIDPSQIIHSSRRPNTNTEDVLQRANKPRPNIYKRQAAFLQPEGPTKPNTQKNTERIKRKGPKEVLKPVQNTEQKTFITNMKSKANYLQALVDKHQRYQRSGASNDQPSPQDQTDMDYLTKALDDVYSTLYNNRNLTQDTRSYLQSLHTLIEKSKEIMGRKYKPIQPTHSQRFWEAEYAHEKYSDNIHWEHLHGDHLSPQPHEEEGTVFESPEYDDRPSTNTVFHPAQEIAGVSRTAKSGMGDLLKFAYRLHNTEQLHRANGSNSAR